MAGDKINKDDIVGGLITGLQKVREELALTLSEVAEFTKNQKAFAETINLSSSKSLKDLASTLEILSKNVKVHNTILNQQYKLEKRLVELEVMKVAQIKALNDAEVKRQIRKQQYLKTAKDEAEVTLLNNKIKREEAKEKERLAKIDAKLANEAKKLSGEYAKQSAHLNKIRAEYKDLNTKKQLNQVLTKDEIIKLGQLEKEFRNLDKILKKVDADAGQFQRNVGNYTGALGDLTGAIGDANKELGSMASGLSDIAKNFKEAKAQGAGFGTALKGGLIGLGLLAAKALADLAAANQGIVDSAAIAAAKAKDIAAGTGTAFTDLEIKTQLYREQLRLLELQLQELTLNEQDYREISQDATIGIQQRRDALLEGQEIGIKRAEKEVEIARRNLELVNDEVKIRNAKNRANRADVALLDKQKELTIALNQALDAQGDLTRTNAAERRALASEQAIAEIELLRSKKLSADGASALLEKQLEEQRNALDESHRLAIEEIDTDKKTLEEKKLRIEEQIKLEDKLFQERINTSNKLLNNQKTTTDKELEIFKEKIGVQFDNDNLLLEKDAKVLAEKLRSIKQQVQATEGIIDAEGNVITQVGLGEEAITELAKVIKIAQENRIENSKRIAEIQKEERSRDKENAKELKKIEEEKIKLAERLLVLENERTQQQKQNNIDDLKFLEGENIKRQEKIQEDLLKNENAFNTKLIDERKSLHEKTMALLEAEFIERKKLLKLQFDADIQAVDHSTLKEEEKDAKKLIIQEKYNQEVKELDRQKTNALTEEQKREVEALKETQKAQIQILTETAQLITSELERAYNDAADKRQEDLDKSIDKRKENIDKQRELAEKGADTQLAFEEAQLAKEELLKAEQQRKDELNKKIIAYWNMLASYAESNPDTALQKTLKNIAIAEGATALFKKLPSAYEGTEDTGASGNVDNKGGKLWVLHPHERVVTEEQNNLIGDLTNKELAKLAFDYRTGVLHSEIGQETLGQNMSNSIDMMRYASAMEKKFDRVVRAVENIETTHVHLDNLGQVITERVKNGILKREIQVQNKSLR